MRWYGSDKEKRVLIRATLTNGVVKSARTTGALPKLKSGTEVLLSVPISAFEDESELRLYNGSFKRELLPAGTRLIARLSLNQIPKELQGMLDWYEVTPPLKTPSKFALIILEEDLYLNIEGEKSSLADVKCTVPTLKRSVGSLNYAFTQLSEFFEVKRAAHTGSVFERMYVEVDMGGGQWRVLDEIRKLVIEDLWDELDVMTENEDELDEPVDLEETHETVASIPELAGFSIAETEVFEAYEDGSSRKKQYFAGMPDPCGVCGKEMEHFNLFVDGKMKQGGWANLCPECFQRHGAGVSWGVGQLYRKVGSGEWLLIGGGPR